MKLLTITGFSLGIFVILVSTIRWYIIFYDPSQALLGAFIGLVILGGSWLHNLIMKVMKKQEIVDKQINAINKFYMGEEFRK
jgi:riboflavin transporter FmnP